jgi:5-methyltetrahydropteroyltriglutamate--homocysteine methyltransferase
MQKSQQRMLTTHVGSLPRPLALRELLVRQERGEAIDLTEFSLQVEAAVQRVIRRQQEAGIDIANNGEQPHLLPLPGQGSAKRAAPTQWRQRGRG